MVLNIVLQNFSLLINNKIRQEFSAPYSPHQNGTAERNWRSLFEMARCLLLEAGLPKFLWNYAVRASAYIRNRCFNSRTAKTPYELLTSNRPNVSNMHVFGSKCYAYVQIKTKLDPRCKEGLFVGYDPHSPAYLIYFPENKAIKRVRCVKFRDISDCMGELFDESEEQIVEILRPCNQSVEIVADSEATKQPLIEPIIENGSLQQNSENDENCSSAGSGNESERRYPRRVSNKPKYLGDYVDPDELDLANFTTDYCYRVCDILRSYAEAVSSPDSDKWKLAMEDEITALNDNDTYELTVLPEGRSVVGGRWVYAKNRVQIVKKNLKLDKSLKVILKLQT